MSNSSRMNRRSFALLAGAAVAATRMSGQVAAQDEEWSFTDDKGVTVTLPKRPERLIIDVNAAAPLWDFGIKPTALFGWNVLADGTLGDAGGNIDPEGIATAGDVNEPIKLEDVVAQEGDLLITLTWTPDDPTDYWSIAAELVPQVQEIIPIIAMSATGSADANTLRFAELAEALGADIESDELVQAKTDFEAAVAAFDEAVAAKPDVTALFISITENEAYVANPADWGDLNMYKEHGLAIVQPDAEAGSYWETISHEQALKYPADMFMYSTRKESFTLDEIKASATFGQHPAVLADQAYGWNQDFIMSYQGMTDAFTVVTDAVNDADKIV